MDFVENNLRKRFDISTERFDQALDIDPNNAYAWLLKGTLHAFMDEGEKAVELTQHARRLSPLDPQKYFFDSLAATACLSNHDFENRLAIG
jgi:adenylate cyclase